MACGFCQVGAELADKGTLGFLQFFECCRGLGSELCKHVVSYWSLRGERGGEGRGEWERRRREGKKRDRRRDEGVRSVLKLKQECKIQATNTKMR